VGESAVRWEVENTGEKGGVEERPLEAIEPEESAAADWKRTSLEDRWRRMSLESETVEMRFSGQQEREGGEA
jgi:hypothetical protein